MKPYYVAENEACTNQLNRNRDAINHMLDAAHNCYNDKNYGEALCILADAHRKLLMAQLQRLYLDPGLEKRTHKDFCVIRDDIDRNMRLVTKMLENPDADDNVQE